jgi:hypothetical protein
MWHNCLSYQNIGGSKVVIVLCTFSYNRLPSSITSQVLDLKRTGVEDQGCDNILSGQSYTPLHGAVIDEYGGVEKWYLAAERRKN